MSFEPREYQKQQILEASELLPLKEKILLQLPTGAGKTVMFSLIARDFIDKHKKAVIILVHRKELMNQAASTIKNNTGITPVLINQDAKLFKPSNIYVAMVESLNSRMHLIHNIGLVIIDECHIANFNKVHKVFKNQFFIGVSATPISSSKKDPLKNYYNEILPGVQIPELIKNNFLSQNITRVPKNYIDTSALKVNPLTGDFDEKELSKEYLKIKNIKNTVEAYRRYHVGKKAIVFNVNIEHSKAVNDEFIFQGFNSKHLDSKSKDRDEILKWFKETPNAILNNVMIATVGYDEPTIRAVILNFDTLSLPKFLQTCGRGGRIINHQLAARLDSEPKFKFEITDMGSNAKRFGDWTDQRDWKEFFDKPENPPKAGNPPKKICPQCFTLIHAASRICDCGYEFPQSNVGEENELGEFIIVTQNIDFDSLRKKEENMEERFTELDIEMKKVGKSLQNEINDLYLNRDIANEFDKATIDKEIDKILERTIPGFDEWKVLKQKLQPKRFEKLLDLIVAKCYELIEDNDIIESDEKEIFKEHFIEPSIRVVEIKKTEQIEEQKINWDNEIEKQTFIHENIEVFHYFGRKNEKVKAIFNLSSKRMEYKKISNLLPSGAAKQACMDVIQKPTSHNGWKFWKFIDEHGEEKEIDLLR